MINTKNESCGGVWVMWNDHVIEHLNNYSLWTDELKVLLEKRCLHLENLGVPIDTGSVIWHWDWFRHCPINSIYLPLIRLMPGIYAHGRTEGDALILRACSVPPGRILEPDGSIVFTYKERAVLWCPDINHAAVMGIHQDDLGGWYHPLAAIDYHTAWIGQEPSLSTNYSTYHNLAAYFGRNLHGQKPERFVELVCNFLVH